MRKEVTNQSIDDNDNNDNSDTCDRNGMSVTDRLNHFLSQQNESTSPIKPRGAHTLTKDFEMLDQTGEKTQRLHLLENALLTIRPTSVQSERIFSNVGKVATKVRARLSDKSLNAIIALRAFYQSESKTNTQ